ncbi:MAG: class I SAM-dependent methyltransferase [Xenococcaceae cyanobacterium]
MTDITKRLASLSPEKRKLLEQLLKKEGLSVQKREHNVSEQQPNVKLKEDLTVPFALHINSHLLSENERKQQTQKFYDSVTQKLNSTLFAKYAMFLNYGYVANESPQYATVELPANRLNINSMKLVLEVIGDCELTGRKILDVGCGRGGTIYTISQYFNPQEITGVDLSTKAIDFCCSHYRSIQARFLEEDAENLPFEENRFDAIINIESSHNYPNIDQFYTEVYRCLKMGGYFLYTDVLQAEFWDSYLSDLQHLGFILEHERDITSNVLLSCDDKSKRQLGSFNQGNDSEMMKYFLAVPGSEMYDGMKNGTLSYKIVRLKKVSEQGRRI